MSSTNIQLPENFEQAKQLMDLIVTPALSLIETKLQTHTATIEKTVAESVRIVSTFENRVKRLETNQKVALWGWGTFATVVTGFATYFFGWVKSHVRIG